MDRTHAQTAAVAAVLGLLATGCGSRGSALPTRQFSDRANAACQRLEVRVRAIPAPTAGHLPTLAAYAEGLVSSYADYLAQLTPLVSRAADRAALQQQWITPQTQQFAASEPLLTQLIDAAKTGDTAGVTAIRAKLAALPDATSAIEAFQRQYGVGDCADLLDDFRG